MDKSKNAILMANAPNIYISSMALSHKDIPELCKLATAHQFPLEFSSSLPYHPDIETIFKAYPYAKLVHNYFPAPKHPFVINLASTNPSIRNQSIAHCLQGLRWTKEAGGNFYCAHAGFCIDPNPLELGKKLQQGDEKIDKKVHWDLFLDSVNFIVKMAEEIQVDFYIENNVTAAMNLNIHGQNPLLCSDPKEIIRLATSLSSKRFGILLDTAHLKVSAKTLGFDRLEAVREVRPFVKAIHHSDNEGLLDNNQAITEDYWFLPLLASFNNIPHVVEVKNQSIEQLHFQINLLQNAFVASTV